MHVPPAAGLKDTKCRNKNVTEKPYGFFLDFTSVPANVPFPLFVLDLVEDATLLWGKP